MKMSLIFAAALLTPGVAAAQTYEPVPPGDGITRMGTNPEGQACTPEGYNMGVNAYPACTAMGGPDLEGEDYPPCTREVKDRCRQTYTRWTD